MKKTVVLVGCALLGIMVLTGCGKNNPAAPETKRQGGTVSPKTFRPGGVIYSAYLSGDMGQKPWYWFDSRDDSSYNAIIYVTTTKQTANVQRYNGGTWGKVRTFPISYSNTANATVKLRIGVPARTSSVAWKILIQEEGGAWRNWELQSSTTETGYKDYDMTSILQSVNAGSGTFTIELVVEGEIGQYIELSDLYVYNAEIELPAGAMYWYESGGYLMTNNHTHGWYDETTNPGFHAVIHNDWGHADIDGDPVLGGKVQSPIITWDPDHCQTCYIGIFNSGACFSVWVQEQTGQYRQWQVTKTYDSQHGWVCDFTSVTELAPGTPFSITIADVFGTMHMLNIYLF